MLKTAVAVLVLAAFACLAWFAFNVYKTARLVADTLRPADDESGPLELEEDV